MLYIYSNVEKGIGSFFKKNKLYIPAEINIFNRIKVCKVYNNFKIEVDDTEDT